MLREFNGYDWGVSVLCIGWSKAVPIAMVPEYSLFFPHVDYISILMWVQ